jgi:hypothetical protein
VLTTDVNEVRAVVNAGSEWASERDLPDPAGWVDLAFGADQLTSLINELLAGDNLVSRVNTLPLPKGLGPENRTWVMPNPIDEVAYRLLGGRLAEYTEAALGPEVLSYRARAFGPGWRTKNFRYGGRVRRTSVVRLMDAHFTGVGALDIRNYYPSLCNQVVVEPLLAAGASTTDLAALSRILAAWQSTWDVSGIPIGPETSGLLGNVGLVSVDNVVRPLVGAFYRMTDDYTLLCSARTFAGLVGRVADAAGELGLELNDRKVRYYDSRADLPLNIFDPEIDALLPVLADDREKGVQIVRNILQREIASEEPAPSRVKFCLSVLAGERDELPLRLVVDRPELMRISPRGFGRYVRGMIERRAIDQEWLVHLALAKPTPLMAAVQYHLLLACSDLRLSKGLSTGLQEFALGPGKWTPLRCAASEAWATSERGRDTVAIQAVLDVGDAAHRRALTLGMRHMNASKHRDKLLTRAEASAPELRPTVSWLRAGAPRAA